MGGSSYQLIHSRLGSTTRKWDCSAAQGAKREEKEFSLVTISVPSRTPPPSCDPDCEAFVKTSDSQNLAAGRDASLA